LSVKANLQQQKEKHPVGTNRTKKPLSFPACKKRVVEAEFSGGDVSSDGGILLVSKADRLLKLTEDIVSKLQDNRQQGKCEHSLLSMLRQRVYGLCLGYEDLNDHTTLRQDPAWQTAVGEDKTLSSSPTLCRLENAQTRRQCWEIHRVIIEKFIKSHKKPPKELILDFDATDDPVHGNQEGKFFNGFYRQYCFLPLYVTCGDWVLVSYLRASNIDAAKHSRGVLSLLVHEFRRVWPKVKIIVRADSGFCRYRMFQWCERKNVFYIVGIAKNNRLLEEAERLISQAERAYCCSGEKQRLFGEFCYAAGTWKRQRRVIVKAEYSDHGANPRFIVTNLQGSPQQLYDKLYCARGDMENRIKEQLEMFSDRTSCHHWWPNQFRLLLSTLAYTLMHVIRNVGLKGTAYARAQVGTIRLKFLKIGAVILRNTRRVKFLLSSSYPYQDLYFKIVCRLAAA
jgi:hypothetical protein